MSKNINTYWNIGTNSSTSFGIHSTSQGFQRASEFSTRKLSLPTSIKNHIQEPTGKQETKPFDNWNIKPIQAQSHIKPTYIAKPTPVYSTGSGAALYENKYYRHLVARERVTEHFEFPQQTSNNIRNAAWYFYNMGNSDWGRNDLLLFKADKFGQASKSISTHQHNLDQPLAKTTSSIESQGRMVIDNLQEGINHIGQLMQSNSLSREEQHYMSHIMQKMLNEQKLILQVMEDKGNATLSGSLDLRQAVELKRSGYDLNPRLTQHFSSLNDQQLIQGSDTKFGSGHIHSVTKLSFQTPSGVVNKIFKGEDPVDPLPFDSITGPENYLDKNKPRFAARNFASAKFDKLLGTNLMPTMELTVHNGQLGVLMDLAEGVKPWEQHSNTFNWTPVEDYRRPKIAASIQQQLNSAEWLDGICAQQDRHAGNLFIDPESGKVSLIDNDMAFYPGQYDIRTPSRNPQLRRFSGSTAGMPNIIDLQTYHKLISITPDQIKHEMEGLLTPQEIKATMVRVAKLQQHANYLAYNGRVISNWQEWRDPTTNLNAAQFQHCYTPDSYLLSVQGKSRGL